MLAPSVGVYSNRPFAIIRTVKKTQKSREKRGVIAYLRVSTEEQADSGAGLAAQEAAIRAECERRGLPLLATHTDAGVSGKSLVTCQLEALMFSVTAEQ